MNRLVSFDSLEHRGLTTRHDANALSEDDSSSLVVLRCRAPPTMNSEALALAHVSSERSSETAE
jgi:hypothetical protein